MTGLIQSRLISPRRDHFAPKNDSTSTDKYKLERTLNFKHITYYIRLDSFLIAKYKEFFDIDTRITKKNILSKSLQRY